MTPSTLHIRRGSAADAVLLADLARRTFVETFGPDNTAADIAEHVGQSYGEAIQRQELEDPEMVTLLATLGDDVAGFAQIRRSLAPECVTAESPVELLRFYVDRPWHGRGVAQRLMAAARAAARELGGRSLWLSVWERNPRAIAFYGKCGFRDVGTHPFVVGSDVQTDRILVTALADAGA